MLVLAPIAFLSFILATPQDLVEPEDLVVSIQSLESQDTVAANWQSLSAESLTVNVSGSERSMNLNRLKTISFPNHLPRRVSTTSNPTSNAGIGTGSSIASKADRIESQTSAPLVAVLRDDSRILPVSLISDGQTIEFLLEESVTIQVNTNCVRSVQFQPLTPIQRTQWGAILDSRLAADTLVLVRSAESLDKIEGVAGEIQSDIVKFEFGGQALNAPRSKLAGLVYFSTRTALSAIVCTVVDVWGNSWNASQAIASKGSTRLKLFLACGAEVELPLECVSKLDFSRGSLLYLADMKPIDQGWKGAIELDIPVPGIEQLFGAQAVMLPKDEGSSLRFLGSGWITFRVPAEYTKLLGTVFLDSSGGQFTPCRVLVKLEEQLLWDQQLTSLSQRLDLSVAVQAGQRLRLEVIPQSSFPVGDVVVWQQLRLQK